MTELSRCPFCGSEAVMKEWDGFGYYVRCTGCKSAGSVKPTIKEVIAAWNNRLSCEGCIHHDEDAEWDEPCVDCRRQSRFDFYRSKPKGGKY